MASLLTPDRMGEHTRALYDNFVSKGEEQCPLETARVIQDFFRAAEADKLVKMPKKEAENG